MFFSAILAAYFAWKTVTSSDEVAVPAEAHDAIQEKTSCRFEKQDFQLLKVRMEVHDMYSLIHVYIDMYYLLRRSFDLMII